MQNFSIENSVILKRKLAVNAALGYKKLGWVQLKSKTHFEQTSFAYAINLNINVLVRHFVNLLGSCKSSRVVCQMCDFAFCGLKNRHGRCRGQ